MLLFLFISIIFIFTFYFYYYCLLLLSILYSNFNHCNYLPNFTIVTAYILTFYWFENLVSILSLFSSSTLRYHFLLIFQASFCACHCYLPIVFQLLQLTATTLAEFKSMNLIDKVYSYLSTPVGKPFFLSIFLFCSLLIKSYCHKFFKLLWAAT